MEFELSKFLNETAICKLYRGYYPCPKLVVETIVTLIKPSETEGCLLDNCAGTGESAVLIAKATNLKPYLIEPHFGRFIACAAKSANSLRSYAEQVQLVGVPTIWFFNPPFDPADDTSSVEKNIFDASINYAIGVGTFCILVLAFRNLKNNYFKQKIAKLITNPIIRAFPEPFFSECQQVIVMGYAKKNCDITPKSIDDLNEISIDNIKPLVSNEFQFILTERLSPYLLFGEQAKTIN